MESLLWMVVMVLLAVPAFSKPPPSLNCIYNNKSNPYFHREMVPLSELSTDEEGRLVVSGCSACFTLWSPGVEEPESLLILGQGCWSRQEDCTASSCNDYSPGGFPTKAKLCCCTADLCNGHIVLTEASGKNLTLLSLEDSSHKTASSPFKVVPSPVFILSLSAGVLLLVLFLALARFRSSNKESPGLNNFNNNNNNTLESSKLLLLGASPLDLSRKLGEEDLEVHFDLGPSESSSGLSYLGTERPSGRRILVKVPASLEAHLNEARIYEDLPPHPCLLRLLYHAEDFSTRGVHLDQILVFCNANPCVPLSLYLKEHTLSWGRLVSFLSSITDGIAHIHSESLSRGSICHRNLSSDNIFVRSDGTLCIGDFSRAVRVAGGNVLLGGGEEEMGAASLRHFQPGDPRYMAPEILEGTLNFRDAESAFKQGDVYSLGLLFWEISRRCEDLYQGCAVPEWEYPFQKEIRGPLNVESMKILVSRYRSRPLFPSVWKESNPAVQLLRETIEDSWDQDGEARLTAFCVRERISELNPLWERYKKNKSNDLSPVNNSGFNNLHSNNNTKASEVVYSTIKNETVFHSNDFSTSSSPTVVREEVESRLSSKNDNVLSNQMPSLRLQPYQGLNPCKERNLNTGCSPSWTLDKVNEELSISGLLLNSSKDFSSEEQGVTIQGRSPSSSLSQEPQIYSPATPIPYTQNPLSEEEEEDGSAPLNLISKENNTDKRSHSGRTWLTRGPKKSRKPSTQASFTASPVVFVDSSAPCEKQCNLDIERALLSQIEHNNILLEEQGS